MSAPGDRSAVPAGAVAARMASVADKVAGPAAADVDEAARFPSETVAALRDEGLLAALVPEDLGGPGATVAQVSQGITALGRRCASSAMVVAMHHIQVACLVRHGRSGLLRAYQRDLVGHQYLLASATTEVGTGGDVRSSICARRRSPTGVSGWRRRRRSSPTGSRRTRCWSPPGARPTAPNRTRSWSCAGHRTSTSNRSASGTPSGSGEPAAPASCCGPPATPGASSTTPTATSPPAPCCRSPTCCGARCGSASPPMRSISPAASSRPRPGAGRARHRRPPSAWPTPPPSIQQFADIVRASTERYEEAEEDVDRLTSIGFGIAMNSLKVSSSTLVVDIVRECMVICGLASYRLDTPYSLGRHLRDAMGAALMVNNDRIMANNAQMLLVHRGE